MSDYISHIKKKIDECSESCDTLSEEDMWAKHGTLIWEAKGFTGTPHFYPVYKWKNYYSYSLLALIVKKGYLALNQGAINYINKPGFLVLPAHLNIDSDIQRIGKPHESGLKIHSIDEYSKKIADALIADTRYFESKNPGYKNYILCGGKDSLNLLLLPWLNETVAISAEPNYGLVKKFVIDNKLNIEVKLLEDKNNEHELNEEALECCCRVDMENWRWGQHLREISKENNGKLIYWKGQMADLYTSDKWKVYMHPHVHVKMFVHKIFKKLSPLMPFSIKRVIGRQIQPIAIQAAWDRGAVMQGGHLGFIRDIADCLVLSAYHGTEMMKVWQEADLSSVAQFDIRDRIGAILHGRPVTYPEENPAPGASSIRFGLGKPDKFVALLKESGIKINVDI